MHVVLLPGMDGTGDLFENLLMELGPSHSAQVIRYPPDKPLGYLEISELVIRELPTNKKYVLLGESFSGPVAIIIASKGPENLVGVILCASFAISPRPFLTNLGRYLWCYLSGLSAMKFPWRVVMGRFYSPDLSDQISRAAQRVTTATMKARFRAISAVDVRKELAEIECPILYMRASADRLVPRAEGDWVRLAGKHVEVQEIPGPHMLLQASPKPSAAIIRVFCDSL